MAVGERADAVDQLQKTKRKVASETTRHLDENPQSWMSLV